MIHLLITNGPQHRDFILERTLQLCEPYFDSIRIIQNGGFSNSLLIKKYTILKSEEFLKFEDCLDILKDGIPEGDWVFVLDSDETPQQELLDWIKDSENRGVGNANMICFPFRHHSISNDGEIYNLIGGEVEGFKCFRMFRVEEGLYSSVYLSIHFGLKQKNERQYVCEHRINHYKHDFSLILSSLAFGLAHPDSIGVTEDMWEFSILQSIRGLFQKSGQFHTNESVLVTPTNIYLYSFYHSFWGEVKYLSDKLVKSENSSCQNIAKAVDFLIENKKGYKELYSHKVCGKPCCEYKVQY